jgi:hypothetical protein
MFFRQIDISDDISILVDDRLCWYGRNTSIKYSIDKNIIPSSICKEILGPKRLNDAELINNILCEAYNLYKNVISSFDIHYKDNETICRVITPDSHSYNEAIKNYYSYFLDMYTLSPDDFEKVSIEVAYRIISKKRNEILNAISYAPSSSTEEEQLYKEHPEKYDIPYKEVAMPFVECNVAITDIEGNTWIISKATFKEVVKNNVYPSRLVEFLSENNMHKEKYNSSLKYDKLIFVEHI